MLNWLWKRLGYHVCEEFTQWQEREAVVKVTPYMGDLPMLSFQHQASRRWQERQCTICGRIEQRHLEV